MRNKVHHNAAEIMEEHHAETMLLQVVVIMAPAHVLTTLPKKNRPHPLAANKKHFYLSLKNKKIEKDGRSPCAHLFFVFKNTLYKSYKFYTIYKSYKSYKSYIT